SSPDIGGKLLRIKGKKLFSLKTLARQKGSPQDSVLGNYSDTKEKKGLTINYSNLIKAAFRSKWWDSIWIIKTDEDGNRTFIPFPNSENGKLEADEFTLMEWKFAL